MNRRDFLKMGGLGALSLLTMGIMAEAGILSFIIMT